MYKQLKIIAEELKDDYPLTSQYVNGIYGLAKKLSWQMSTNKAVDTHEDFFQVMLIEACKLEAKFDKERGSSFYTFINRPLRAAMFRSFVAINKTTDTYKDIKAFVRGYEAEHHLYPSVDLISDTLDIPSDVVRTEYYGKSPEVSLTEVNDIALVEEETVNPLDHLDSLDVIEKVVIELMYSEIPEDEAEAFTMLFLQISKPAFDEIHTSALAKLREALDE